jgi:hypothetical protein
MRDRFILGFSGYWPPQNGQDGGFQHSHEGRTTAATGDREVELRFKVPWNGSLDQL